MKLSSEHFNDGAPIPGELAFCIPAATDHVCLGGNHSPQLSWSEVPAGTRSFVITCHDPDVPSVGDDVNQEGREVAASLPTGCWSICPVICVRSMPVSSVVK